MIGPIDFGVLGAFTLLWLAIVPTPGANSLMVGHVAMTRSAGDVALAIAGNMAGVVLLASLALFGWAAVLQAFPWLRLAVDVIGAAYLIYFGCRLVGRSMSAGRGAPPGSHGGAAETSDPRRMLLLGFVTALSNAQAIVFITSIYAVTGILDAGLATGLASIAVMVACNASYLAMLGWLFQRAGVRSLYQRFRPGLEAAMGALFVVFGGRLMLRALAR